MSELDVTAPANGPDPAAGRGRDATRSQIRGSSLLLAGQAFAMVTNLAAQVLIVRLLSQNSYGAFAYCLSIVALAETLATLGMHRGVSRFIPMYEEQGQLDRAAGTFVLALSTALGLGLGVVLTVIGLRGVIAGSLSGAPEATTLLAILIVLAPIQALERLLDGTFAVFVRPRVIAVRRYVFTPLARLAVVGVLFASDGGVELLAIGYVLTGALGIAVYGAVLVPVLHERGLLSRIRGRQFTVPARELLGFTVPLLTNDVTGALMNAAGAILLGVMAGAADVASLRAVLPISLTMTYVLTAFGLLFVPLASRLLARGDTRGLDHLYWQTAGWTAVLSFPVFILGFAFGEQVVLALFGERYAGSGAVLATLVIGHFLTAVTGPNGVVLAVHGKVRFIVWTNVAAIALNLVAAVALIPVWGATGAAAATTVTLVVLNVGRQFGIARHTAIRAVDRDLLGMYGLLAAVTAALVALDALLAPALPVGAVLVAAASLAVMLRARRVLALADTFPELARVPVLGPFLSGGAAR